MSNTGAEHPGAVPTVNPVDAMAGDVLATVRRDGLRDVPWR